MILSRNAWEPSTWSDSRVKVDSVKSMNFKLAGGAIYEKQHWNTWILVQKSVPTCTKQQHHLWHTISNWCGGQWVHRSSSAHSLIDHRTYTYSRSHIYTQTLMSHTHNYQSKQIQIKSLESCLYSIFNHLTNVNLLALRLQPRCICLTFKVQFNGESVVLIDWSVDGESNVQSGIVQMPFFSSSSCKCFGIHVPKLLLFFCSNTFCRAYVLWYWINSWINLLAYLIQCSMTWYFNCVNVRHSLFDIDRFWSNGAWHNPTSSEVIENKRKRMVFRVIWVKESCAHTAFEVKYNFHIIGCQLSLSLVGRMITTIAKRTKVLASLQYFGRERRERLLKMHTEAMRKWVWFVYIAIERKVLLFNDSCGIVFWIFFSLSSAAESDLINDKELFPDLPAGCLDRYRKAASFDYRKLALLLDNEECIRYRVSLYDCFVSEWRVS